MASRHFLNFLTIVAILPAWTIAASIASQPTCAVANSHCECVSSSVFYSLQCANVTDLDEFGEIIANLSETAAILEVSSLEWDFFPLDTLRDIPSHTVIIKNSTFKAFGNSTVGLSNVTASGLVRHFALENVTVSDPWEWKQLAPLDNISIFFAYNTTIGNTLNSDFSHYMSKSLLSVTISHSNITNVENDTFKNFKNLTYLRIFYSKLTTFSPGVLPVPTKLEQLRLDYNKIHTLPSNLFQDMPDLKVVSLSNNTISTLPEEVFRPLWRPDMHLELRDNPIKCDCRILWTVTAETKPKELIGHCVYPKRLFGRDIKDLTEDELDC